MASLSMRTTLSIEDDAMTALQAYARAKEVPLGRAASELIRRGLRYQLPTKRRNGLLIFDVPDDFPEVTMEMVRDLENED